MMKKVVKLCSIALILLLLLSVVASCGGNKTTSGDSETDTATVETSDDVETLDYGETSDDVDTEKDDAPVAIMDDFGGYQFKVLTRGSGMYKSNDITGEVKGDVLSLATYK